MNPRIKLKFNGKEKEYTYSPEFQKNFHKKVSGNVSEIVFEDIDFKNYSLDVLFNFLKNNNSVEKLAFVNCKNVEAEKIKIGIDQLVRLTTKIIEKLELNPQVENVQCHHVFPPHKTDLQLFTEGRNSSLKKVSVNEIELDCLGLVCNVGLSSWKKDNNELSDFYRFNAYYCYTLARKLYNENNPVSAKCYAIYGHKQLHHISATSNTLQADELRYRILFAEIFYKSWGQNHKDWSPHISDLDTSWSWYQKAYELLAEVSTKARLDNHCRDAMSIITGMLKFYDENASFDVKNIKISSDKLKQLAIEGLEIFCDIKNKNKDDRLLARSIAAFLKRNNNYKLIFELFFEENSNTEISNQINTIFAEMQKETNEFINLFKKLAITAINESNAFTNERLNEYLLKAEQQQEFRNKLSELSNNEDIKSQTNTTSNFFYYFPTSSESTSIYKTSLDFKG